MTPLLLALAAAAGQPAAPPPPPPPTPAVAKADKSADRMVCRLINTTGSRLGHEQVCKTQAEWNAESDETRDEFENAPRRPGGDPSPIGPG